MRRRLSIFFSPCMPFLDAPKLQMHIHPCFRKGIRMKTKYEWALEFERRLKEFGCEPSITDFVMDVQDNALLTNNAEAIAVEARRLALEEAVMKMETRACGPKVTWPSEMIDIVRALIDQPTLSTPPIYNTEQKPISSNHVSIQDVGDSPETCILGMTTREDLKDVAMDYVKKIHEHQEKFAAAFLKETGLNPTEVLMNIQQCDEHNHGFTGTRIWFEKKSEVLP